MLRLRHDTEDWRELLGGMIDEAESATGQPLDANCYDDAADSLCCAVLDRLTYEGIAHERAWQQCVGNFVIVQSGTDVEREAYFRILYEELPRARPLVERLAYSEVEDEGNE